MLNRHQKPWSLAVAIGAIALIAGCEQSPVQTVDEIRQEYVFQVEYQSSWLPSQVGIVIDRTGKISSYRREGLPVPPASDPGLTREELAEKYSESEELTRLDPVTLVDRFNQTLTVRDRFSEPNLACADAGVLEYTAFGYDLATELYYPLTLRAEGDRPRQNITGRAQDLANWLRALLETFPVEGLEPFPDGVCTP